MSGNEKEACKKKRFKKDQANNLIRNYLKKRRKHAGCKTRIQICIPDANDKEEYRVVKLHRGSTKGAKKLLNEADRARTKQIILYGKKKCTTIACGKHDSRDKRATEGCILYTISAYKTFRRNKTKPQVVSGKQNNISKQGR